MVDGWSRRLEHHYREVVESHRFSEDAGEAFGNAKRADEALEGLSFTLSRLAQHGMAVTPHDPLLYSWVVHTYDPRCVYRIFYTFDENEVVLQGIGPAVLPETEAGD